MKKLFKRFCAYFIDIMIVYLLVYVLTSIPFINVQLDDYNKAYKNYEEEYVSYMEFVSDLEDYYEDNKLTEKEYSKLKKNASSEYVILLDKYYKDNELIKTNYNRLIKKINSEFQDSYEKSYYSISKYSTIYNIIYIVLLLVYFVGVNIWLEGQTFGKKLLKLKVVSNKDDKKLSWINYLVRALVLYNPVYYLAILVGPYVFNVGSFYNWALVWGNIKNYLEMFIMVMIIIRLDNRGLHELLSGTKVMFLDEKDSDVSLDEVMTEDNDIISSDKEVIKKDKVVKKKRKNKKIIIDEEK